jgi:ABC-type bacteriocin/lantibiotic exporter with double-glycine peptidase domain
MAKLKEEECILTPVQQTLDTNCTSACIAMITGLDIDRITTEFHDKYIGMELEPTDYLRKLGFSFRKCLTVERKLKPDYIYLVALPSLNIKGAMHNIVIQTSSDGKRWYIIDPNEGREYKEVYPQDTMAWIPELEFTIQNVLAGREVLSNG